MTRSFKDLTRDEEAHALALHREAVVIDASLVGYTDYVGEDIWVDDMLAGGVTACNATVCMQHSIGEALRELKSYHSWAERSKEKALIVESAADIAKAKKEGRHGVVFGPQDSSFLEGTLHFLKIAYDYGVRVIQLTYNNRCAAGDGCRERGDAGLSNFGVALVEEMNRLGVLVDLSHTGDRSSMDAIEISRDPVSFTHTLPRASTPREISDFAKWNNKYMFYGGWTEYALQRAKTDEAIKACAEKDGVIGITPFFAKKPGKSTLTDDILDQIDYTADLVGADHVGFGSDVDFNSTLDRMAYIGQHPENVDVTYYPALDKDWGYGWLRHMPNLTRGLVSRGYSDAEVKGVIGENFYRLFRKVWRG
ncbi:membrane dipeptidase [Candidatus Bathyarchaeota archaeon]|nr:membrane dipeptidase [Candidatus Bathyarchaeota archaeon]